MILFVGFPLGFISLMMFSPMGSFMTELFPTRYAAPRRDSATCRTRDRRVFPALVGFLAARMRGPAIAVFSFVGYGLMIAGC